MEESRKIKNIIYLDEQKLYSLSAQIFEGVTDTLSSVKGDSTTKEENQKGPVGSGRNLAKAIRKSSEHAERKYLHDYSFTLFEDSLRESGQLLDVLEEECFEKSEEFMIVRISAPAILLDPKGVNDLFTKFNKYGEMLAYFGSEAITRDTELNKLEREPEKHRQKIKLLKSKKIDLKALAKKSDWHMPDALVENLKLVMGLGFGDDFEIVQKVGDTRVVAPMKDLFLREARNMLLRKYSIEPSQNVVVLGLISQKTLGQDSEAEGEEHNPGADMKGHVLKCAKAGAVIKTAFQSGREVTLDPIAAYFEI